MRVYLSSYQWGDRIGELQAPRKAGRPARAAVILNALDAFGTTRDRDLPHERAGLEELGYETDELDLRSFFGDSPGLAQALARLDLLWAVGGNAFVLGRAVTASGLAGALRARAELGPFVWAGYSAGACVAGPDLAGIEVVDDPHVQGAGHPVGTEPSTLRLVPFRIVPHWESDHPETELVREMSRHLTARALEHRRLRDGESLLLDVEPPAARGAATRAEGGT